MPAHSLGDRRAITTRVHPDLREALDARRAEAGVGTVSQYVADLIALHLDRPDLVLELGAKEATLLTA